MISSDSNIASYNCEQILPYETMKWHRT